MQMETQHAAAIRTSSKAAAAPPEALAAMTMILTASVLLNRVEALVGVLKEVVTSLVMSRAVTVVSSSPAGEIVWETVVASAVVRFPGGEVVRETVVASVVTSSMVVVTSSTVVVIM